MAERLDPSKWRGGPATGRLVLAACLLGVVASGLGACSRPVTARSHEESEGAARELQPAAARERDAGPPQIHKIRIRSDSGSFDPQTTWVRCGETVEFVSECQNRITVRVRDGGEPFADAGSEFHVPEEGSRSQRIKDGVPKGSSYNLCVPRCDAPGVDGGSDGGSEEICPTPEYHKLTGLTGTLEVATDGDDDGDPK